MPSRKSVHEPNTAANEAIRKIREMRFTDGLACVYCRGTRIHRWGCFSGRQRYRCPTCHKTFSDLTGTPAANLKRVDALPAFVSCMRGGMSVRATARVVGVHKDTSFRWRHRLLARSVLADATVLDGLFEYAETWLPHSLKGQRPLDRPARRRGARSAGKPTMRVWVPVGRDRANSTWSGVAGHLRPRVYALRGYLWPRLLPDAVLLTSLGPLSGPAILMGGRRWGSNRRSGSRVLDWRTDRRWPGVHARVPRRPDGSSLYHTENVGAYIARLHDWLERFRGVSTRWLHHYLRWHRLVDREAVGDRIESLLRWPLRRRRRGGPGKGGRGRGCDCQQFLQTEPDGLRKGGNGRSPPPRRRDAWDFGSWP